ncbi:hypothetical protein AB0877_16885 [Micromonospora sp. NPDC047644]|uniref:hypothetical protein n=1 Tax=Micromonospora sp. NPDC047644 TaxID=3157203 RepID=UPI003454F643
MKVLPWLGAAALAVGVAILVPAAGSGAADSPPSLEEDFNYPGAAAILAEHGVKLHKGDGHVLWTGSRPMESGSPCLSTEVQVEQILGPEANYHCFRTLGATGYLTLEISGTFGIRGGARTVEATAQLPEGPAEFTIPAGKPVPIRPGSDADQPEATLVEIRIA